MTPEVLTIHPRELMCLVCGTPETQELIARLRQDPAQPVRLVCAADSVYAFASSGEAARSEEKRDLDILQRLGLVPGDTRPALDLLERLFQRIPDAVPICTGKPGSRVWQGCPQAHSGAYEAGIARGVAALLPLRSAEEKAQAKRDSVAAIRAAAELAIRPHHLLCLTCFHRGREAESAGRWQPKPWPR